jgi:hypothetical protein
MSWLPKYECWNYRLSDDPERDVNVTPDNLDPTVQALNYGDRLALYTAPFTGPLRFRRAAERCRANAPTAGS